METPSCSRPIRSSSIRTCARWAMIRDELRVDLPAGERADPHRRERDVAPPLACRSARGGARQPGSLDHGEHRARQSVPPGLRKLKRIAKVDMTFIPYPGNGPSVNALLGEHVTMMF